MVGFRPRSAEDFEAIAEQYSLFSDSKLPCAQQAPTLWSLQALRNIEESTRYILTAIGKLAYSLPHRLQEPGVL
jgi:hypothetical protein